jgi:serine/threonine-protein kinase PpkA
VLSCTDLHLQQSNSFVIDIPGYRILRQLGRGGMATVYLAIQQSVDREVALKIMNPALLADPNFGERFLREARIAAKLHHRHVVGVHDVGKHGDVHYIAMEHLGGGPILRRDGQPRDVVFALRVVREIATALGYAHAKGFVHRDIKPDNILLREDGSAVLTDFGIARAADSATRMTRTGAVIGTPHYMSPEQARGRTVDGRADLYSLGVVLYEMLVGRVPFHAEDSLAVGIMHITEPPPPLPEGLSALQPMLDVMLAKKPEERYQTGEEMTAAIREHEVAIARGELPSLVTVTPAEGEALLSSLPEPSPLPAPREPAPRGARAEPRIGATDAVDDEHRPRRAQAPPPPHRSGGGRWLAALVAVFGLGAGAATLWVYQDRVRALLPHTELNTQLTEAEKALAADQLTGTAGTSALERYRAVLREDADNAQALDGVRQVGERLLARARGELAAGDVAAARAGLQQARDVLQGGPAIEALGQEIAALESRSSEIDALLEQAIAARDAGRLTGTPDAAAALFARVLVADPGSGIAQKGLDDIVAALDAQASAALAAQRLDEAEALAAQIEGLRAGHSAVPALRARVADARAAQAAALAAEAAAALEALLARGEAQLRAGNLLKPAADSARANFEQALARDPGNARATAGLARIGSALLTQADAALDANDVAAADRLLREAGKLGAPAAAVLAARSRARELRERQEIAAERPTLSPEQSARLERFLADADAALAGGALNEPPGGNAYDLYRAALSIDRANQRAKAGLAAIAPRATLLFDEAIAAGRPAAARPYLDAFADTSRDAAAKAAMRSSLGRAYAAQGGRQLDQGQREAAQRSLARARDMAPDDPAVQALAARLAGG